MLNTAFLSQMSQNTEHTRYEEIILGRILCEDAPQVVSACSLQNTTLGIRAGTLIKRKNFADKLVLLPFEDDRSEQQNAALGHLSA